MFNSTSMSQPQLYKSKMPRESIVDIKRDIVLGHGKERKTSASTGPRILFHPLLPVSGLQKDTAGNRRITVLRSCGAPGNKARCQNNHGQKS